MSTATAAKPEQQLEVTLTNVRLATIVPSPTNPRKTFDKAAHEEMTKSVEKQGILQPLLLRAWGAGRKAPKEYSQVGGVLYELVAGERRVRAAKAAGLEFVPALVRELGDAEVLEIQLIENLQRNDLHPLEEAEGFRRLIAAGYDLARLAERIGRSVKFIYDREKLLALTKEAQKLFVDGRITTGHAIVLSRISPADQKRAIELGLFTAEQLLDFDDDNDEGTKPVSVRELQAWIDKNVKLDTAAPSADLQQLFPAAAAAVVHAEDAAENVIHITEERDLRNLPAEAKKGGQRVFVAEHWKRADKACASMVTGVVVLGPGRGEAFKVCTDKKGCKVHWAAEQKAAREVSTAGRGATGENRHALEQQKRKEQEEKAAAERKRWEKAVPEIRKALGVALTKAPISNLCDWLAKRYGGGGNAPIARGKGAEGLVRYLVGSYLARDLGNAWWAPQEFPRAAKAAGLSIDLAKILEAAAPADKPTTKATAKAKTKKR